MKATEWVRSQHARVRELVQQLARRSGSRDVQKLINELATALAGHMLVEQEIFFPACAIVLDDRTVVRELLEDHGVLADELRDLTENVFNVAAARARLPALRAAFARYVDREEKHLLSRVHSLFRATELEDLGGEMEQRLDDAIADGFAVIDAMLGVDLERLDWRSFARLGQATTSTRPKRLESGRVRKGGTGALHRAAKHAAEPRHHKAHELPRLGGTVRRRLAAKALVEGGEKRPRRRAKSSGPNARKSHHRRP